jgi:hypothetical protein
LALLQEQQLAAKFERVKDREKDSETERETDREKERKNDRQKEREKEREKDREEERERFHFLLQESQEVFKEEEGRSIALEAVNKALREQIAHFLAQEEISRLRREVQAVTRSHSANLIGCGRPEEGFSENGGDSGHRALVAQHEEGYLDLLVSQANAVMSLIQLAPEQGPMQERGEHGRGQGQGKHAPEIKAAHDR